MDLLLLLKAAIMGIVEGITEFLPISSTGHLILASELMNFWTKEKSDVFVIAIQMGAIAAVIYEYWARLWGAATGIFSGEPQGRRLGIGLILASIPIVLIGLTFGQTVKELLFNDIAIAIGLIVGGLIIIWIEKHPPQERAARGSCKICAPPTSGWTARSSCWCPITSSLSPPQKPVFWAVTSTSFANATLARHCPPCT